MSESVIAAICLLDEKSVDEIVAKLSPVELELKGDVRFVYAPEGFECVIRFATEDLPTHPPKTAARVGSR